MLASVALPRRAAELECASWVQFSLQYILANSAVTCVRTETTSAVKTRRAVPTSRPRFAAPRVGVPSASTTDVRLSEGSYAWISASPSGGRCAL